MADVTTTAQFKALLDHIGDAAAVFSSEGHQQYCNRMFLRLPKWLQSEFALLALSPTATHSQRFWQTKHAVKRVELGDSVGFIVSTPSRTESTTERTLKLLIAALEDSPDIFHAAASAIQQTLGWRWVAITRYKTSDTLEVLALFDNQHVLDNYVYDIAGTPCQSVIETRQFTHFANLLEDFPNYQALHEMGALAYAGLVYRDSNGHPLGHVMAMHDSRLVDFDEAEDVIKIATISIATQLQLTHSKSRLKKAERQVKLDSVTGISNRLAFDLELAAIAQAKHANVNQQTTLAIIDLDNLKPLNDQIGHAAGDQFIQLMATELKQLSRDSDQAFRIGGDEFAMIFAHDGESFCHLIKQRFTQALQRIREQLQFNVNASIGFASLAEVDGDIEQWIQLADQRMYQEKAVHRKQQETTNNLARGPLQ
jgi:diguanylate cyclase (GGDEF)-like protein